MARVGGTPSGAHRAWCEACVRGRGRNADHRRQAAEQDQVIDTMSVDYASFGEHDLTAEPVDQVCNGLYIPHVLGSFALDKKRLGPSALGTNEELQRFISKSDQEPPSVLDLKNKVVAEVSRMRRDLDEEHSEESQDRV